MQELLADIRLALRSLARRPLFAAAVLVTLALGIGANTAVFSVVNGVLLRPFPYRDADRLALIWSRWSNFDKTWLSPAEYLDYQKQQRVFQDVAAWSTENEVILTGEGGAESVGANQMSANLLDVLGVTPVLGRTFSPVEDAPNGPAVTLIGHNLWVRRFGSDPGVLGRVIVIDGSPVTIIGVLPREFRFPLEFQTQATVQIVTPVALDQSAPIRGNHSYFGIARLQPGITSDAATAELAALARRWTGEGLYPESMQFSVFTVPLADEVTGPVRGALLVLLGAVGLLLLLACANVANLLLTRAGGRARELAVRAALGAGRGRMLRLTFAESGVLGFGGGLLGLGLAWIGVRILVARAPTSIPRAGDLEVDGAVLGFTLLVSVATGLLFGALPALQVGRINLAQSLRDGARAGESTERRRGLAMLVMAETALAVALVIGAGLAVRSFINLTRLDPGFDSRNVLTLRLSLPQADYQTTEQLVDFYQVLGDRVRGLPGVKAAGFVRVLPLADEIGDAGMEIEGKPVAPGEPGRSADWQVVTPGYFEAMGERLVAGRFFDGTDTPEGLPVIAINETLARQYFPGENALGQRIRAGGPDRPFRTIVGIVGDSRHNGLTSAFKRKWFIPHNQFANVFGQTRRAMTLVARTEGEPMALVDAVRREVAELDRNLPLTNVRTMEDVMAQAVQEQRFTALLMSGFALLALVLAAVGIYGVIAYSVSRRTQEIGVRLALGATPAEVRSLIVQQGMRPVLIGIAIGLTGSLILSRSMTTLLYGVSALDPWSFLTMPALLLAVALCSALIPAIRATRIDPVAALRSE